MFRGISQHNQSGEYHYKIANTYELMKVSNYKLIGVECFRIFLIGESLKVDEIDGRNKTRQLRIGQACLRWQDADSGMFKEYFFAKEFILGLAK